MLNRFAMRLCAVYALQGRTFAGTEVRDSEIVPVDPQGNESDTKPFIAVYTDDQAPDEITLTIEIGVSARMAVIDEEGKEVIVPGVPPTDAGIEALIDMIERQIHVALADEENGWGQLLKRACSDLKLVSSQRGAMKTGEGERFAGRQVVLSGNPIADPEFGREISETGFWGLFLAKADTVPALEGFATQMRALLLGEAPADDWRLVLRAMGYSRTAGDALGVTPAMGMDETPQIVETQIETDSGQ